MMRLLVRKELKRKHKRLLLLHQWVLHPHHQLQELQELLLLLKSRFNSSQLPVLEEVISLTFHLVQLHRTHPTHWTTFSVILNQLLSKMTGSAISRQTTAWAHRPTLQTLLNKLLTFRTCTKCTRQTLTQRMTSTQLWTTSRWAQLNPLSLSEDSHRSTTTARANLSQATVCPSNKTKTSLPIKVSNSNSNSSNRTNLILSETNSSSSSLNSVVSNRPSSHLSVGVSSKLSSQLSEDPNNSLLNNHHSATSSQLSKAMPLKLLKMV